MSARKKAESTYGRRLRSGTYWQLEAANFKLHIPRSSKFLGSEVCGATSPFHDFPLIFHRIAAQTEESIVEVHGGIAVRDDESQFVSELNVATRQNQPAMFVAGEFVCDAADPERFGSERAIG